ncbi:hypothetical protein [Nocardia crassostreae]|uniref:hypothetical protein n=1 Tax=Nocardia crassostreae TaxID=53428 RepID=UPI00082AB26A|nr:hypothetical protein [Nocardia crassostreae]
MSPHLATGMQTLTEAANRFAHDVFGAKVAATVAKTVGKNFYARTLSDTEDKMVQRHKADPATALAVTDPGLQHYRKSDDHSTNITYNDLVTLRAPLHIANGDPDLARQELVTLAEDLSTRGVNPNVLKDIRAKAKSVPSKKRSAN